MAQLPFTFRNRGAPRPEASGDREREAPRPPPAEAPAPSPAEEPPRGPPVLTVTQLQQRLRGDLEARYAAVLVAGEISNCKINGASGHAYFTLKDRHAQVTCTMWSEQLSRLRFRLEDGMEVIVRGRVTVYPKSGTLQINVLTVEPTGLGALQQEYRERVEKLRAEGLTAKERKRPLPAHPRVIGVVTSPSGAALRDVVRTLLRRDPQARILISPTPVQGRSAAFSVVQALKRLDALERADVILVVRGGGSIEDLWAFNEEPVARAIAEATVPVIAGIGHETDTTIADLVADRSASTPTAAAELACPERRQILARWRDREARLHRAFRNQLATKARVLLELEKQLRDPEAELHRRAQELDELTTRAERAIRQRLARARGTFHDLAHRLARQSPERRVAASSHRLALLERRLAHLAPHVVGRAEDRLEREEVRLRPAVARHLTEARQRLAKLEPRLEPAAAAHLAAEAQRLTRLEPRLTPALRARVAQARGRLGALTPELHAEVARRAAASRRRFEVAVGRLSALSPLAVLSRGFALVTGDDGRVVRRALEVEVGQTLGIRLGEGTLEAEVTRRIAAPTAETEGG